MKNSIKVLSILIFIHFSFQSKSQNINPEWVLSYGGPNLEGAKCTVVDDNNDVILMGYFTGLVDFDPTASNNFIQSSGVSDVVIQKVDLNGTVKWTKSLGNAVPEGAVGGYEMITDPSGDIYIGGRFTDSVDFDPGLNTYYERSIGYTDNFILKLDVNGDFKWVKTFGSTDSLSLRALTKDFNNNIIVSGEFKGTCDFDPGIGQFPLTASEPSMYVLKLDTDGNFIWAENFESTNSIFGHKLSIDQDQNIFIAGQFSGTVDFDPGAAVNNISSANNALYEAFVLKLNSSGEFLWVNHYGYEIGGLQNDANGNVFLFGSFYGLVDFGSNDTIYSSSYSGFIQKLNSNGNNTWVKVILTDVYVTPNDLNLNLNGDIYITGNFKGETDFDTNPSNSIIDYSGANHDAFILKISANGDYIWHKSLKGINHNSGTSISTDSFGGLYVVGYYEIDCDFGGSIGVLNSKGESDMFLMKIGATASTTELGDVSNSTIIYPNPTNGSVTITSDTPFNKIEVMNALGQKVGEHKISETSKYSLTLPEENGVYILKIYSNESMFIKRVVKDN